MTSHDPRHVRDLDPDTVSSAVATGSCVLVDVREPAEIARGIIAGAVAMPLSRFDPRRIAVPAGCEVVFYCAAGVRSVRASQAAQAAGFAYNAHLAGGVKAWIEAGKAVVPPS
jgi:rhodanese-related sulfurtransferase